MPRQHFLPGEDPGVVYRDGPVTVKHRSDGLPISSSSQPAIMAAMLEQLDLYPGQRVLEIGTGSGYNAALIAQLVGDEGAVTSVDIDQDLIENAGRHLAAAGYDQVSVVCADGGYGLPEHGPYDRIIATVGAWDLARAWLDHLAPDGRLVVPLSLRGAQRSVAFDRADGHLASASVRDCGFMRLRGTFAGPDISTALGADVFLQTDDDRSVDTDGLRAALAGPGSDLTSDISISTAEAFGGFRLWLALYESDTADLAAFGAAAKQATIPALMTLPGQAATVAVFDEQSLAALVQPQAGNAGSFPVTARGFGSNGGLLAERLIDHARRWDDAGRPATHNLHIDAYPVQASIDTAAAIIDRPNTRLALTWL